ncbi:MAG: hypothetical protein IKF72_11475 [Kiritimatiellae bacterium]|nr:hypothetical protein [Kiritimatiellia bacterium]
MREKYMPSCKVNDKAMNLNADIAPAQCAEVYLCKTGRFSPCDILPFRAYKFPHAVKESI